MTQTGVYKIDANFLKKVGIDPTQINPRNLRLYGNGGVMLPQANAVGRPQDLIENAVLVKGEADGKFDESDALWFYGQSPHEVRYNATQKRLEHQLNPYSDTTFYFLQIADRQGLRIQLQKSGNSGATLNSFDDYLYQESELYNRIQSGREWWGAYFGTQTRQEFTADVNGLLPNSPALLTVATVAAAQVETKFSVVLNGQALGSQSMATVSTFRYDSKGQRTQKSYETTVSANTTRLALAFTFDKAGQSNADGYLDFFGVQVKRNLQLYDKTTVFQNLSSLSQDSVRYTIAQADAQMQLWDVTDPLRPREQQFRLNGTDAIFGAAGRSLRRFAVFLENHLQEPVSVQPVANQNLRAMATPNLLIVTPARWWRQAQRLAGFRSQNDGLSVQVVTLPQVFNEFSSGRLDPTAIRDFVRHIFQKQPNTLQYLLLFGDATYDYKNIFKAFSNKELASFVPTYESRESAHPVLSFSSDDYFGFLETDEGEWEENFTGNHTLDIGVGRLPVKSDTEAETVVNKIIRYAAPRTHGPWRQRVAFVADDGDNNLHQQDAEELSKIIAQNAPQYDLRKVYVDAFPIVQTPLKRAPKVNEAVDKNINEGVLVMNYTGHGGVSVWADEQIVTLQDLLNWRSIDNMPLVVTATCEFGRYDNPAEVSGAEVAVLNPRGGAIAMLTTARPVYASTNFLLNDAFYRTLFRPINGQMPRLGDVMRLTKNQSFSGVFNRNFTLLGDPSLRLNYADLQVNISTTDTLKAGRLVRFGGEIVQNNQLKADFNGTATVTVFGQNNTRKTLGQDGSPISYQAYNQKLFEGKVSVKQGKLTVLFVVPKEISTTLGFGRVQVYALSTDSLMDAMGANNRVVVGGVEPNNNNDAKPPNLNLYLNDENFVDGSTTDENPVLMAQLLDENGLNVYKNMVVSLNDTFSVVVNDYFTANKDDYQRGTLRFPFQKLPEGMYDLRLQVFDTYNNSSTGTLKFKVSPQANVLKNVTIYPNPLVETAVFQAELYSEGDDVEIQTQIFDLSGRLIKTHTETFYNADSSLQVYRWDGTNIRNSNVTNGLYLCQITARSLTKNQQNSTVRKLMLLK
ncbi:MAG: type IX secretion system sortase PorU [Spirosomaceae bacterium]|nr:type IX secretion system sortase PorU [Spirosomataceae bacterium]